MTIQKVRLAPPLFGAPVLRYQNNGMAGWCKENSVSQWQKGSGWTANLYGGTQTGDDWAAAFIPVNELHTPDFNSALWTYYMTNAEVYGVNMVIWLHDPNNNDNRVEVTQAPSHADLAKASGWNAHELDTSVAQFFYYGENVSGSGLTSGSTYQYTWAQYQTDDLFRGWTIYRISLERGWYSGDAVFEDAWVADIKLNGQVIRLQPDSGGSGRVGKRYFTGSGSIAASGAILSPKTPFRLLSVSMHLDGQQTSASGFVLSLLSSGNHATHYDVDLLTDDMDVPSGRVSLYATFGEGYEFSAADEIDLVYTNGGTKNYGLIYTYEVL